MIYSILARHCCGLTMFYRDCVYGCGDARVCGCDAQFVCGSQSAGRQRIKVELNITQNFQNNLVWGEASLVSTESLPLAL